MDNLLESAANATTEQPTEQPSNLLQTGVQPDTTPLAERIPEKFRVINNDQLDLEASTAKMLDSYTYMEKRMGSSSAPPKTAAEYHPQVEIEGFEWESFAQDESTQGFLERAHKLGASNELIGFMLQEHINSVAEILPVNAMMDSEEATEELRAVWRSDDEIQRNVAIGVRAVKAAFGEEWSTIIERNGNNPDFIRMAAAMGSGMQEDSPPQAMQTIDPVSFDNEVVTLRSEMDQLPKNDPRRGQMLSRINALYSKRYGDSPAHGL